MAILVFILFGFIVGLIARALMPGRQKYGFLMTSVIGIGGSFLGGLIGNLISSRPVTDITPAGLIGSIIGALIVLALISPFARRARL